MSKVQTKDNYLSKDRPGGKEIAKDYQVQTDCSNLESESIGQVSKAEYDNARSQIARRKDNEKKWRAMTVLFSVIISLLTILGLYIEDLTQRYSLLFYIVVAIVSFIICLPIVYCLGLFTLQAKFEKYQIAIDRYVFAHMQEDVEDNIFESSLKMSYKYLDQYYAQTREQAKNGFLITICVTLAGASLLFVSIICMFLNKIDASKITVASGVIIEFISAIMFYLYNKTIQRMGNYHDKLFLSQNISIALKISDSLSDAKRDDIKSQIVKELITDVNAYIVASDYKNKVTDNKQ